MLRSLLVVSALLALTAPAAAQSGSSLLVLVVDPGPTRLDQAALRRTIGGAVGRTVIRMTDERAQQANGRLTIAFSQPDRWVLRYEAHGEVSWVSDRIARRSALSSRLAALSRDVIGRVERSPAARARAAWDDDLIVALQDEIVDPFADDPPRRTEREPVTILWSEVVDPFRDQAPRADANEVWSEVLDPWAQEVRPRRRPR